MTPIASGMKIYSTVDNGKEAVSTVFFSDYSHVDKSIPVELHLFLLHG